MRSTYPVIFTRSADGGYTTFSPDFNAGTQGDEITEAIRMTRDMIALLGIDMLDDGEDLPQPFSVENFDLKDDEVISFVDVDFDEYRSDQKKWTVQRSVTLPAWLNAAADRAGLNVSALLQNALKSELKVK